MFGPDFKAGCATCSTIAVTVRRLRRPPGTTDVSRLAAVSRAPFAKLQAYKRPDGVDVSLGVSFGSDFNTTSTVSFTEEQQPRERRIQLPARREVMT